MYFLLLGLILLGIMSLPSKKKKKKNHESVRNHESLFVMCRPNGLVFHQKSLDMGSILVKKILRRGFYFKKIAENCKISHF